MIRIFVKNAISCTILEEKCVFMLRPGIHLPDTCLILYTIQNGY